MSTKPTHYKVDKDKPMATAGTSFGKLIDLSGMEVGDSFTFPIVDMPRVKSFVNEYGKKNGASFFINCSDLCTCWRKD